MASFHYGFGDTDAQFTAILLADGLPATLANRSYSDTYQADYKVFRTAGIAGPMAYNMMETLDRDAGAMKSLAAGTPPDLVVQAWQNELFVRGSPTSTAILAGQNPTAAITAGLAAISKPAVTTTVTGPSQAVVSDYLKNLPAGVTPGSDYTIINADGSSTTYHPDWSSPSAPATAAQIQQAQAAIPATSNYWTFPSGDVESSTGAISGPAAATVGLQAPISIAGVSVSPQMLLIGAGLGLFALMSMNGQGRRR